MDKSLIIEQLKKKSFPAGMALVELDYFAEIFRRAARRDHLGLLRTIRLSRLPFQRVLRILEEQGRERLRGQSPPSVFEYEELELIFTGRDPLLLPLTPVGGSEPDRERLLELFFHLSSEPFGARQVDKIKELLAAWGLQSFLDVIWQNGLNCYLAERYAKLNPPSPGASRLPLEELARKVRPADLFDAKLVIDNYIYDKIGGEQLQRGLKADLFLEKQQRWKAEEKLAELLEVFDSFPPDLARLKERMLALHMDRQLAWIERHGILELREHVKRNWFQGALAAAAHCQIPPPPGAEDAPGAQSVLRVNDHFLRHCAKHARGRSLLQREALLGHQPTVDRAACWLLPDDFLVVALSPHEEEDHFLFGQYRGEEERQDFLLRILEHYFRHGDLKLMAGSIIAHYLESLSGRLRVRTAIRVALYSLPVVLVAAALVAWVYQAIIGGMLEALLIGGTLAFIGEAIAVRNGYTMPIRPEDHGPIPEYVVRDGVVKLKPLNGEELSPAITPA